MPNVRFLNRPNHPTFTPPPAFAPSMAISRVMLGTSSLDMASNILMASPQLFQVVADTMTAQDKEKHRRLDATLDKLRTRYGRRVVYYGSVQESRDDAPMRISFTHIPDLKIEQD